MKLRQEKTVKKIISLFQNGEAEKEIVKVEGSWGSFGRLLAANIFKETGRPILYICPHIDDADKASDDFQTFGAEKVQLLNAWEGEEDLADATDEIRAERLRLVSLIGTDKFIVSSSIQAICQPIPNPKEIEKSSLHLQTEKQILLLQKEETGGTELS